MSKNIANRFASAFDFIEKVFSFYITGVIVVIIGIFITAEIIFRLSFNYSFFGVVDLVEQFVLILTFFCLAGIQSTRDHITVDIIPLKLVRRRAGYILDSFLLLLNFIGMLFIFGSTIWFLYQSYNTNISTVTLFWPVWPFALGMVFGVFLMLLRLIIQFKKSFMNALYFRSIKHETSNKEIA